MSQFNCLYPIGDLRNPWTYYSMSPSDSSSVPPPPPPPPTPSSSLSSSSSSFSSSSSSMASLPLDQSDFSRSIDSLLRDLYGKGAAVGDTGELLQRRHDLESFLSSSSSSSTQSSRNLQLQTQQQQQRQQQLLERQKQQDMTNNNNNNNFDSMNFYQQNRYRLQQPQAYYRQTFNSNPSSDGNPAMEPQHFPNYQLNNYQIPNFIDFANLSLLAQAADLGYHSSDSSSSSSLFNSGSNFSSNSASSSSASSSASSASSSILAFDISSTTEASAAAAAAAAAVTRSYSQNFITQNIRVKSSAHVSFIVGKQGIKIRGIRDETRTFIQTPVNGEEPIFVVSGIAENVRRAKERILADARLYDLSLFLEACNYREGNKRRLNLFLPARFIGLVVGKRGNVIKRIMTKSGAKIETPKVNTLNGFKIYGTDDEIRRAIIEVKQHIVENCNVRIVEDEVNGFEINLKVA